MCENKDRNGKLGNKNMPYSSIYWVEGSRDDEILRHSGYEEWPIPIARHTTHDLNVMVKVVHGSHNLMQ